MGAIRQTPLVELGRITANIDGRILAKLEYLNPGFPKKDRAALRIIEEAEELQAGQTVRWWPERVLRFRGIGWDIRRLREVFQ